MIDNAPARVLVLVEEKLIADVIELTLNHGQYVTRHVVNDSEAAALIEEWQPHLAVVDMDIAADFLATHLPTPATRIAAPVTRIAAPVTPPPSSLAYATPIPVLALTRRGNLTTKLAAFDQGVDDIMTMPFSPEELLARVVVITRRTYGTISPIQSVLKVGEIEIDIMNRLVRVGTTELHLTGLEQSLLYLLAARAGQVVTRDEILDALWGTDFVAESNIVDRHVRNLRAKLQNDYRKPRFIATVPGQGYRFIPVYTAV